MEDLTDEEKLEIVAAYAKLVKGLMICLFISLVANVIFAWERL